MNAAKPRMEEIQKLISKGILCKWELAQTMYGVKPDSSPLLVESAKTSVNKLVGRLKRCGIVKGSKHGKVVL
jgi:hypothetical protein